MNEANVGKELRQLVESDQTNLILEYNFDQGK